jgi:PKD repeat protein
MKRSGDSGNLSIDFLVGFTIFIIAFIWVVSMIPGLLINLQGFTIDYDAVAYRTGVILVEDPGMPAFPQVPAWENAPLIDVGRFGLAISRETPNILSQNKVNQFFCLSVFSYPDDYQKRVIFGDYPYQFNISLIEIGSNQSSRYVGDIMPATSSYGSIRRLVKIKGPSNATINYTYMDTHHFINGDNETRHEFSILINNTELVNGKVTNPIYQIDPAREKLIINITDLNKTLYADRENCFNISLAKILIYVKEDQGNNPVELTYFKNPIINGTQYSDITSVTLFDTALPKDIKNISLVFDPKTITWSDYSQVYVNLTFDLVKTNLACACPTCPGSRFLNNTFTSPFDYNYDPDNVTQPQLRDAVLEVSVGSGYRSATEMLIKPLNADFTYFIQSGTTVIFADRSTGSPVDWAWNFGEGNTSTLNSPTHTFPGPGTYTVSLTVKNAAGDSNGPISKTVELNAPVAGFSGSPLSGPAPLPVIFTDASTNNPTSWKWEYNKTVAGSWTLFSTARNPTYNFPAGTYDIRLTATNTLGSNTMTTPAYITAIPLPVADFYADHLTGAVPLSVIFTNNSANGPFISWKWERRTTGTIPWTEFGSGAPNPTDTFSTAGDYDIQLTVTNSAGSNTMTKTGYIHATAVPVSHTITASAGSGGTIAPSGAVTVSDGDNQAFIITPSAGYHITDVIVNTSYHQGAVTTYTFNNVVADHTISATFAANTPTVIFSDNFNAALSPLWIAGGTPDWYAGTPKNGSHSIQLVQTERITRTISTAGYTNIILSCALGARSLEPGETVQAQYSTDGGTNWIMWAQINDWEDDNALHNFPSIALPSSANNNPNFMLRFRIYGSGTGDYGYIDDVQVAGTHT